MTWTAQELPRNVAGYQHTCGACLDDHRQPHYHDVQQPLTAFVTDWQEAHRGVEFWQPTPTEEYAS